MSACSWQKKRMLPLSSLQSILLRAVASGSANVKSLFRDTRNMRNYIVLSDDLKKNHPKLFEMVQKLDYESWRVCENTKRVDRRLRTLQQKVSTKIAKVACPLRTIAMKSNGTIAMKSIARKEAGKVKAASLTSWRQDFRAARDALKQEGYTGSLKLRKDMPMYAKIQQVRRARISEIPPVY